MKKQKIIKYILLGLITLFGMVLCFSPKITQADSNKNVYIYKYKLTTGTMPKDKIGTLATSLDQLGIPTTGVEPLAGIIYEVRLLNPPADWQGAKVWRKATVINDSSGNAAVASFTNLPNGKYTYRELKADEYALAHRVDATLPESIPNGVIVNPKTYTFTLTANAATNYYIAPKNQVGEGQIKIIKQLRSNPLVNTTTAQANVVFKLYDEDYVEITKSPKTNQPLGTLMTDGNGELIIAGLAPKTTYYLKEVAPPGTIPDQLGYRKIVSTDSTADEASDSGVITFVNNTAVKKVKSNLTNTETFTKEAEVITEKPFTYQISTRIPDQGDGELTALTISDHLQAVNDKYYTYFQADTNLTKLMNFEVIIADKKLEADKYSLLIRAEDKQTVADAKQSQRIVGFTLKINDFSNYQPNDIVKINVNGFLIDAAYQNEITTVYPNKITTEVKYTNPDENIDHIVTTDSTNIKPTQEVGYFKLQKQNSVTHEKLAGAVFDLYRGSTPSKLADIKASERIATDLTTDAQGEYISKTSTANYTFNNQTKALKDGLPLGEYYLVETKAPTNYLKATKPIRLMITKNNQGNLTVRTIDNIQTFDVPETGGIGTAIFYLLGGLTVAFIGIVVIYRLKDAKDDGQFRY